jgi:phage terminase small subunit
MEENEEINELNEKQKEFCRLYVSKEFFGNGVQTYIEVYDIDQKKPNWYQTACVCASQLLSNPKVFNHINELLEEQGLTDQFVDKQMLFLIQQHADLTNKLGAIKEYNKLKGRITEKIQKEVNVIKVKAPGKKKESEE